MIEITELLGMITRVPQGLPSSNWVPIHKTRWFSDVLVDEYFSTSPPHLYVL